MAFFMFPSFLITPSLAFYSWRVGTLHRRYSHSLQGEWNLPAQNNFIGAIASAVANLHPTMAAIKRANKELADLLKVMNATDSP
jgi:hypothetical protein